MSAGGTVAQTYLVELDARSVQLEAALAASNTKLASFEQRLASLQRTNDKTAVSNEALGVSFATEGDKIKFTALGIGAALVAIEVKATEMATAVEASLRQIGAASPALRSDLGGVADAIDSVAEASGRDKDEIRGAAEEIARLGVSSKAELEAKLKAATLISDATGTTLSTAVEGVTEIGRAFNLTSDEIVAGAAKIYSASKGKVDFDTVFAALKQAIPRIKELGLDYDTAISAIVAKVSQGFSGRKLGAFFTDHDAETIRAIAREAKISANALGELQEAAQFRRDGSDRDITRAVNEYKTALESLGKETLPFVTTQLSGMAGILATIDGTLDKLKANSAVSILRQYGLVDANKLPAGSRAAFQSRGGDAADEIRRAIAGGNVDLTSLTVEDLNALKAGVDKYADSLRASAGPVNAFNKEMIDSKFGYQGTLDAIQKVIDLKAKVPPPAGATAGSGAGGGKPGSELTIAQKGQLSAFNQSFDSELAALSPDKGDDLEAKIQKIRDEAKKLSDFVDAKTLDVEGKIQRLRGAAAAAAGVQLSALKDDLEKSISDLSEGQADRFEAASKKLVDQKRKELAALVGISDEERTAFAQRIVAYEAQAANAAVGLRALDEQAKADRAAAVAMDQLDQQIGVLEAREAALTAVIQNGHTPRVVRLKAEKDLADLRRQQIDLANQESAAVVAEIARDKEAIANLAQIRDQIQAVHPDDKTAEELQKTIDELTKKVAALQVKLAQLGGTQAKVAKDTDDSTARINAKLDKQARIITACVNGALQLGEAFGIVDQSTANALKNIGDIAVQLPQALAGDPGAIAGIVGSAVNLISAAFGGNSQADEDRRRILEANTEALRLVAAGLTRDITGTANASTAAQLKALLGQGLGTFGGNGRPFYAPSVDLNQTPELKAAIEAAAKAYGITLDGSRKAYEQLLAALEKGGKTFASFGGTFGDTLQELEDEFKVFNITDPIEQLRRLSQAAGAVSPAIKDLMAGLDLSNAADREALNKRIEDDFERLKAGGFTDAELGGMTAEQFYQLLLELSQRAQGVSGAGSPSGTGGYSINREITETTGGHLVGLMTSSLAFERRIAEGVEAILAAARGSNTPISVPTLPPLHPSIGMPSGPQFNVDQLVVQVTVPVGTTAATATEIGSAIGDGFMQSIEGIDKGLGQRATRRSALKTVTLQ